MKKADKHYEYIILIVAAIAAIGVSLWLMQASQSFADSLKLAQVAPKHNLGDIPLDRVKDATTVLTAAFHPWQMPVRANKPVPLNKSVLLVFKDDQIYDLFTEEKLLRPPMSNAYLREYHLDFLSPNVGDLDPDNDGFTNAEEFAANTNPQDPKSHPPLTNKLFFVERISHDYIVVLKGGNTPPYNVQITPPGAPRAKGFYVEDKAGEVFGLEKNAADRRFEFKKFEAKSEPDAKTGGEKNLSEMTIYDRVRKNNLVLVFNVPQNLADYDAKFEYRLGGSHPPIVVPKGGDFRLPGAEDVTYKVIDIQDDSAVISPLKSDGTPDKSKEIVIKKA